MSNDHDDAATDHDTAAANHSMPDPFVLAIELCRIATSAKTIEPALKRLRKLGHDIAKAEQKLAALSAAAEQTNAELAERAAAADERDRAHDAREVAFASQAAEVRDELRKHHNHLEQTNRQLVHRIMATTGILGDWNWELQSPPTWQQLRQKIAGLPADLPAAPPAEVITAEVREDWTGNVFVPNSTLSRSINKEN
jgi:hypothetical protein